MQVNFETFEEYENYIQNNSLEVCKRIKDSIYKSLRLNLDQALLFEIHFKGSNYVYEVRLDNDQWINSLNRCLKVFTGEGASNLAIETFELKSDLEELFA